MAENTDVVTGELDDGTNAAFVRFYELCDERFGARICTVFAWSAGQTNCVRVWANNREAYPYPALKPMGPTAWGEAVLNRKEAWEALSAPEVRAAFFDYPVIASLCCGCCLSAPVLNAGQVIGAASILDHEGVYATGDSIEFAELAQTLRDTLVAAHLPADSEPSRTGISE